MKSNPHIKSIFEQISEKLFVMKDLNEAKSFIINFVNDKNINEKDKKSILLETNKAQSLVRLQTYICNSLLKYEGMGMDNFNKTAREAAAETSQD